VVADLRWSWLAAPYSICTVLIVAVAITAALVRGDRVLRLGVIASTTAATPWALCQAIAACATDPTTATRLLRNGQGPVALVGPALLLVLLGASGQLERYRWTARIAALLGGIAFAMAWGTDWVVPSVQVIPSGMFYVAPGPMTGLHFSQLAIWLVVGMLIAGRSTPRGAERRRTYRILIVLLVITMIGTADTLLLYRVWGTYPIAWLVASIAAAMALYLMLFTDFLRPQGLDRGAALELGMFAVSTLLIAGIVILVGMSNPLPIVALCAVTWTLVTGFAWTAARARPVRVKSERELDRFIARVPTFEDERKIDEKLAALWQESLAMDMQALWWRDGDELTTHDRRRWKLDPEVVEWLIKNPDPLASVDLATMRLGPIRAKIEALGTAHNADMIVPLSDRDELVGLAEVRFDKALREAERGLVAESARAAARALTFVELGRVAARQRATAREVEVADALRLHASASREASLGRWAVAGEYRTAGRTTGAGWSAIELADGRLAVLVAEAQAHGVAAALATAAITGAFAAATAGKGTVTLDEVLRTMRASSEGVLRGGEPVAAFLAIIDASTQKLQWACAGHPGAFLIGPVPEQASPTASLNTTPPKATPISGGPRIKGASLHAAARGEAAYPPDTLLVVASSALRGEDDAKWRQRLLELAPTSSRLASVLVETTMQGGEPAEDLLAVVVRSR
jgi:hypothetical protein